jgi:hypothetical protein
LRITPRARYGALLIEPLAGGAQPALTALGRRDHLGQLVAAAVAERLGFGRGGDLLLDDRTRDLLVVDRAVAVGVGRHLRAVNRDHADRREAGVGAQAENLAEQLAQRALMPHDESRDRGVIRTLVRGDHAAGHVLQAGALDPPR